MSIGLNMRENPNELTKIGGVFKRYVMSHGGIGTERKKLGRDKFNPQLQGLLTTTIKNLSQPQLQGC